MYDTNLLMGLFKMLGEQKLDVPKFYQMLVRAVVQEMACSRASVWVYDGALQDRLVCVSLFDAGDNQWSSGVVLSEDDFAPYFAALRDDRELIAAEARSHPACLCFSESYFEPLNIYSLIDVSIEVDGALAGVVCCEQTTLPRAWNAADHQYVKQVAAMCGLVAKKFGWR